jgi:oligopeptidase B
VTSEPASLAPPVPESRPVALTAHGDERIDEWYWLSDREDPAVIAHLEAENGFTAAMTKGQAELRDRLYEEIVARIQETDLSVPTRRGPWWYYSRTVEGLQYPIHCRRPGSPDGSPAVPLAERPTDPSQIEGSEVVLLDENEAAGDGDFFAVGEFDVSPDHRLLAYSTNTDGSERYTLRFRDLSTGQDLDDVVEGTYYGLAWAADSLTVLYTKPDEAMRPYQLWRHRLGTAVVDDVCILTEQDERFFLSVGTTKDHKWLVVSFNSQVTGEVMVLRADDPEGEWLVIEPRRQGIEYHLEHHADRFLIVTNDGARNFRLMETPVSTPSRENWREVIAHDPDVRLEGIDVFVEHLALYERAQGSTRVRIIQARPGTWGDPVVLEMPEMVGTIWGGGNPEYGEHILRFGYTSLVTPQSVFDYDMATGERRLLKRQPVLGDYDPSEYRTERRWATGEDGAKVPVSIVYRSDLERDGSAPALLYGYGSYELSIDPSFSSIRLSLLERGFVFAIAHVRGGGEMGRGWYEDGKLLNKKHTFSDFVASARLLIEEGWTSPQKLAARGGSAGGLLMGAVANAAPDLFGAIVAEVPFVDCVTTILDETLPLTVIEWEEWGNPVVDEDVYWYMKSYAPYDNVADLPYPAILATGGLNDPRVGFWEPAKWVAKLRRHTTSARAVLLKTELGAGHHGPSGRYDTWRDEAFVLAFVLDALGVDK